MWGLTPEFMQTLEDGFKEFFANMRDKDILKAEYLLPIYIDELLQTGRLVKTAVEIVTSTDVNIAEDTSEREVIEKAAYGFHKGLAEQIVTACIHAKEKTGCQTAALSGGVFQNGLLLRLTEDGLIANGFRVLTHQLIPPNDGGIALGQAFYGMNHECVEEAPIL